MKSVSKLSKVLLAIMYLIFTSCIHQSTNDLNKKLIGFDDKKQMDTNNKIPKKKYQEFIYRNIFNGPTGDPVDEVSLLYRLDLSQIKDESLQNSILYYYFRLPPFLFDEIGQVIHKYGENGIFQNSYYKDRLVYQNINHGFLKVMSDIPLSRDTTKKSGIEIALFKYQNQNIIATNFPDFPFINFLRLDDVEHTWYDIDHEIFPNFIHEDNGGCWKKDGNYDLDGQCNVFFKLPEYGTQILGIRSDLNSLENPEAFWQDKLQNAPEEIIRLNWQDGKFVIESPTPKWQSGGGGMPIVAQEMALDTEDIPQIPTFVFPGLWHTDQ